MSVFESNTKQSIDSLCFPAPLTQPKPERIVDEERLW